MAIELKGAMERLDDIVKMGTQVEYFNMMVDMGYHDSIPMDLDALPGNLKDAMLQKANELKSELIVQDYSRAEKLMEQASTIPVVRQTAVIGMPVEELKMLMNKQAEQYMIDSYRSQTAPSNKLIYDIDPRLEHPSEHGQRLYAPIPNRNVLAVDAGTGRLKLVTEKAIYDLRDETGHRYLGGTKGMQKFFAQNYLVDTGFSVRDNLIECMKTTVFSLDRKDQNLSMNITTKQKESAVDRYREAHTLTGEVPKNIPLEGLVMWDVKDVSYEALPSITKLMGIGRDELGRGDFENYVKNCLAGGNEEIYKLIRLSWDTKSIPYKRIENETKPLNKSFAILQSKPKEAAKTQEL